jgi:hypothetical protein
MFAVKSKFKVGAATSVVATSTVLGASVVVEDADGTAVEPAIPPVVVVVVTSFNGITTTRPWPPSALVVAGVPAPET